MFQSVAIFGERVKIQSQLWNVFGPWQIFFAFINKLFPKTEHIVYLDAQNVNGKHSTVSDNRDGTIVSQHFWFYSITYTVSSLGCFRLSSQSEYVIIIKNLLRNGIAGQGSICAYGI